MKILIIALSGIGDALMFTPALKILKEQIPDAEIDAMVMYSGVKDIYSRLPQITNVYLHDFLKKSKAESFKFVINLRKKYDVSINVYPSNRKEYNVISFLTGAGKRVAVSYKRQGFRNLEFLNNIRIAENDNFHNVETNIKMVECLTGNKIAQPFPGLMFPLKSEELQFADTFFSDYNLNTFKNIVGFHPGCSTLKNHINRRWEPGKFIELGKRLISARNTCVLIFGGPDESALKSEIYNGINSEKCFEVNVKNLAETAAVMKKCSLFVTNDSSLMHVASAMNLKTAAIIGPTNTNYIRPWNTGHKICTLNLECSPCFFYSPKPLNCSRQDVKYKCIKELSADFVFKEIEGFMDAK